MHHRPIEYHYRKLLFISVLIRLPHSRLPPPTFSLRVLFHLFLCILYFCSDVRNDGRSSNVYKRLCTKYGDTNMKY